MKTRLAGALLLAGALSITSAYAAGMFSTYPVATGALTGNEISPADTNLPNGANPQTETISTNQYRAVQYSITTPLTGTTVSGVGQEAVINPAGTLAALTVVMPASPVDGQRFKIFSSQTLTSLTLTPGTGNTMTGGVTTLAANGSVEYTYNVSGATWTRDQ